MITVRSSSSLFTSQQGWLTSRFHFSFAQYHNPNNVRFGVLRVLNDDIIAPQSGFDTHPHRDMEIITYVIEGELTHKDSLGNAETLSRGDMQYMSAGNGVEHSEYNRHAITPLRLLQLWILPPEKGLPTLYGSRRFSKEMRHNTLLPLVSKEGGVKLHQDASIWVSELDANSALSVPITPNRQLYFVQIEGSALLNGTPIEAGDGAEITNEEALHVKATTPAHFLFVEMAQEA
ncbi:pirin family protein [Sulfurospirillum sp. T05]|uniref:Pirin family protein n=1 Tax=Sulfurospirillum tamanense TaxID=2813362 RepID=A0ABS2WT42_9BACT|nr:pirin family protein [Sulfurospirillum tamanensis]MBN2964810.1 pirin family protein [Sulfurospirillum tamanensis]